MKILFVNPFGSNWVEGMQDKTATAIRMAPSGTLSIAAYLEQRGVDANESSYEHFGSLAGYVTADSSGNYTVKSVFFKPRPSPPTPGIVVSNG